MPGSRGSATAAPVPAARHPQLPFRTIRDFLGLCGAEGITLEKSTAPKHDGANGGFSASGPLANLQGVFLLTRKRG